MEKYISFDLETLGTHPASPIAQIGAVKFNMNGEILSRFLVNINLLDYAKMPLVDHIKPDYGTILWWLSQDKEAQESVFFDTNERVDPSKALNLFEEWITEEDMDSVMWSHNSFDPNVLKETYLALGRRFPFLYRNFLDIRTLLHLSPKQEVEHVGVKHNALHDAIYQARYIAKSLTKVKTAMTYV